MFAAVCSSAVRASHASRESARLTQAFFEDQPSHVRSFPDTAVSPPVLPQGLSYRPASAKGDVGAEGRIRFCCLSGAAVPGSRGRGHDSESNI